MINSKGPATVKTPKRAALAGWVGSALEYYDFFIYGTGAALVFNKVFFASSDPATGTLLALATFGVGYVARPVGAFFMGHIGDRYGRKPVLLATVLLMGLSTFLVGCLPSYGQVGVWAPIALVALRLLQGLSASGEQSGATAMTLEHSPDNRRAFFTSFTLSGTQVGLVLASAAFLPFTGLPEDQLLSWGWRVPFWLSAIVVAVGIMIRRTLQEPPAFTEEAGSSEPNRPIPEIFRHHKASVIRVALTGLVSAVSTIFSVYSVAFAVGTVHLDKTLVLWAGIVANLVSLAAIPLLATVADRVGRKPVYLFGILGSGLLTALFLPVIAGGNYVLIFAVAILAIGIAYQGHTAVYSAFYSEMFPTRVRLSGIAIGSQIGFAIAGFAPTVAAAIAGPGPGGWVPVAVLIVGVCAVAAIAMSTGKETGKMTLAEIDDASGARTRIPHAKARTGERV